MIHDQKKLKTSEQGFTFLEVLAAILITTVFTLTAMQAIVIATVFRVKAQQYSEAKNWIQENLEQVKYSATQYYDSTNHVTRCQATDPNNGYAAGFGNDIGTTYTDVKQILNKNFQLTRTAQVYTDSVTAPYNVLKVFYEVKDTTPSPASIAYFQTEIIPDQAFSCPLN